MSLGRLCESRGFLNAGMHIMSNFYSVAKAAEQDGCHFSIFCVIGSYTEEETSSISACIFMCS